MSGTREGGLKAAKTNKARNGEDFYKRIGQKGGQHSTPGGFGTNKIGKDGLTGIQRSKVAGAKGGRTSRRGLSDRVNKIWEDNKAKVYAWQDMGIGQVKIAKMLGISVAALRNRLNLENKKEDKNGKDEGIHVGNRSLRSRIRARVALRNRK